MDTMRELVWEYAAHRVFPEDLPMAAAQALARGLDSPALRELAGLGRRSDAGDIRNLFERTLGELVITLPSPEEVSRRDLHRLAQDLVAGRISPGQTARVTRFTQSWMNPAESDFVNQWCSFDDILDDLPAERIPVVEAALLASALEVVGSDFEE